MPCPFKRGRDSWRAGGLLPAGPLSPVAPVIPYCLNCAETMGPVPDREVDIARDTQFRCGIRQ